jgi:hypothetical protein
MSVPSAINRVDYTGNGSSTGPYSFSFPVYATSDLQVYYTELGGSPVLKTINTHYTQTAANIPGGIAGGSITLVIVPGNLSTISLVRSVPITQQISFTNLDKFDAKTAVEQAYDRAVMAAQQLSEALSRALVAPINESASALTLPTVALRKSSYFGWDASSNPIPLAPPVGTSLVSTFGATLIDDADATTALATLGAPAISSGTWTPGVGGTATYTTQAGTWVKIGNMVYVRCELLINAIGSGSTDTITGTGLPNNAAAGADSGLTVTDFSSLASSVYWIGARINAGTNQIVIRSLTAAGGTAGGNAIFGNGALIAFSGWYST